MSEVVVQASFNSGEWSPKLFARVDVQKYKSGAALLKNFFVDYRGGASTRTGTRYITQAYKSSTQVRLITFQASFSVGYVLELGNGYIRFFYNGSPIVETALAITAATKANPCVITVPGNSYLVGQWIYVTGVGGMTQLNGKYYSVLAVAGNNVTLGDLNGNNINSTGYSTYTSGGTAARVYTLSSPYTSADDLRLIKFAQSVGQMILCHPNHVTYVLTLISATNWTITPIAVGATISAPSGVAVTSTLGGGSTNYSYGVTSIDSAGQESSLSSPGALASRADLRVTSGSNQVTWTPVTGAVAYNIYKTTVSYFGAVPVGVEYGFIGNSKNTTFIDSNISADFSQTPPVSQNPFGGAGVDHVTMTAPGTYTTVPTVTFSGSPTISATAIAQLQIQGTPTITGAGAGFAAGDIIQFGYGIVMIVNSVLAGAISSWTVVNFGSITSGSVPANPIAQTSTTGAGTGATMTATWGVGAVIVTGAGAGFSAVPTVIFSSGAATAIAVLSGTDNGHPTVPGFVQQRLVLGGASGAPQTFYMSRPGQYFNFDISDPSRSDDAVTGTVVSNTLNTIKSVVGSAAGMLILTDKASWLVNGGQSGAAITPTAIVANPQSFIGASDVPPIVANYDILYVQSKGTAVRDLAYNIYFNTFTGTDISITASHLFFGYVIEEWCWAEQPFYQALAVRSDGVMLSLTFLKEQDFIGWTHYTTLGSFVSCTTATESGTSAGTVDSVYVVVERQVGGQTVKYIERFAERVFTNGLDDAWCVDAGLRYSGTPTTTFSGAEHLAGLTVTGLADGEVIPSFVMPANGSFTLAAAASEVVIGLGFTCDLQTLPLEMGEPSDQGKTKKIVAVDIRVADTLELKIGSSFNRLVRMQDLVLGNVSSTLTGQDSQIITGLVTGDARQTLDPTYTVPGQFCIRQDKPYPASILGVFPVVVGNKE